MGFDELDRRRIDAGRRIGLAQQSKLRLAVRRNDAVAGAVLVDACGADHAMDMVAVGNRPRQRLQEHCAHALAGHKAVGARFEGVGPARGRQHAGPPGEVEEVRRAVQRHAADQRHLAFARGHAAAGLVQRHEGTRTGSIDGDGRPAQVEEVGKPRRNDGRGRAPHGLGGGRVVDELEIVAGIAADEDADIAAPQATTALPSVAGILDGLPGFFEEEALLRVHVGRFDAGDVEEAGIEGRDVVEERALMGRARPAFGDTDQTAARVERLPEFIGRLGAGEAGAETDDRHRIGIDLDLRCRNGSLDRLRMHRPGSCRSQGGEVPRQAGRAGMAVEIAGLEADAERLVQRLDELDGIERIEAIVGERFVALDFPQLDSQAFRQCHQDQLLMGRRFLGSDHGNDRRSHPFFHRRRWQGSRGRRGPADGAVAAGGDDLLAEAVGVACRECDGVEALLVQHRAPGVR